MQHWDEALSKQLHKTDNFRNETDLTKFPQTDRAKKHKRPRGLWKMTKTIGTANVSEEKEGSTKEASKKYG